VKLVKALKALWSRSISNDKIDRAEELINEFLEDLEDLNGKQAITYNAHLVSHLPNSVRRFGPLWTHSCFRFENFNKHVKSFCDGTTLYVEQLVNGISRTYSSSFLASKIKTWR
jgi:hypothetical protein